MSDRRNLEGLVTDWLRAGAPPRAPDRVLASALGRVAGLGQERPLGGRWVDAWQAATPRLRLALAIVVLGALLGAIAGVGSLARRESRVPPSGGSNGWVAYSRYAGAYGDDARNGQMDLYVVRAGTEPLRVAGSGGESGAGAVRAVCPSFSPDGTRLAFGESRNPTLANDAYTWSTRAIVVITLDANGRITGPSVRIAVAGTGVDPCPTWSADGGSLVFLAGAPPYLAIADVAQGTNVPIAGVESVKDVDTLVASPNRPTVALAGELGIWLIPIGGGTQRVLARLPVMGRVAWSPDGTRIAAASGGGVQVLNLDGTSRIIGDGDGPAWSPDGRRIAFDASSRTEIVVANPDGSDPHVIPLTSPALRGTGATIVLGCVWSPDSSHLVFASDVGLISVSATGDPAPQVLVAASGYTEISQTGISWQRANP